MRKRILLPLIALLTLMLGTGSSTDAYLSARLAVRGRIPAPSISMLRTAAPCVLHAVRGWQLVTPCNGNELAQYSTMIGRYPRSLKYTDVWIFEQEQVGIFNVLPLNPCYPAPADLHTRPGWFEQRIRVGESDDDGNMFKLLVVTVPAGGPFEQKIESYLKTFCNRGNQYPSGTKGFPLMPLPAGTAIQAQIDILRSDVLRGPPPMIPTTKSDLPGSAQIDSPTNGSIFNPSQPVAGGPYSGLSSGETVWLLAFAPDGRWYPQSKDTCSGHFTSMSYGRWSVPVTLGRGPRDSGESFYLVPVLADSGATSQFEQALDAACNSGSVTALSYSTLELPQGIKETAQPVLVCFLKECKTANDAGT